MRLSCEKASPGIRRGFLAYREMLFPRRAQRVPRVKGRYRSLYLWDMLKRLHIENFTVFADADFEFGPGLNVLVGTNGTGKSHVLKLGYALLRSLTSRLHDSSSLDSPLTSLVRIFRPEPADVAALIRRHAFSSLVYYELDDDRLNPGQVMLSPDISHEAFIKATPADAMKAIAAANAAPVFVPAKEVLTMGWLRAVSRQLKVSLDETYLDLLTQLSGLPLQQPEPAAAAALQRLTAKLQGEVTEENGAFHLTFPKEKRFEMNMVAEGFRKFGTLQKLLANGSLTKAATLFWDEPEANLNPALLRELAQVLAELARQGFQIILATHSIGLLKQFHILSREKREQPLPIRYFGLNAAPGEATTVTTVDDFELLPNIVALDVELEQADDLEAIFAREDQAQ